MNKAAAVTIVFFVFIVFGPGCAARPVPAEEPAFSESPYRALDTLKEGTILHIPTGVEVTKDQMFRVLSAERITYIGETHTNLRDHQVQLEILKGLWERFPGQVAVGMEMFQKPAQKELDRWSRGELDEKAFIKIWYANWDQDYAYYRNILEYIRDKRIPLVALNASDQLVHAVMEKGTGGLPEDLRRELPEMDLTDTYHRNAVEAVFGGHAHGEHGFERFYQTMLTWDETMAQSVATYLSGPQGRGKKMVVFSGGFHVHYGFGIPRRVFKRLPEPYAIVMPYTTEIPENRKDILMNVEAVSIPLYLADFVWVVGYEDLEDRKVHLGVHIEKAEKGVRITGVMPDSAASKAGIREGDIAVSFDGQVLEEPFDLSHLVSLKKSGDQAEIRVLRGDRTLDIKARFEK